MAARAELLRSLRERIRKIETGVVATERPDGVLGLPVLSRLFPDGQLPPGSVLELLSTADGTGATALAITCARQTCGAQQTLVVVDQQRRFYPPAAVRLGIDLERTLLIRPATRQEAHVATAMALRCPAIGCVVAWCEHLTMAESRRLQLAAEAGGGYALLLRPASAQRMPTMSTARWLLKPLPARERWRRVHVEVLRCRGTQSGQTLVLEIDDATGRVRLPAEVATAAARPRAARASG